MTPRKRALDIADMQHALDLPEGHMHGLPHNRGQEYKDLKAMKPEDCEARIREQIHEAAEAVRAMTDGEIFAILIEPTHQ